MPKYACSGNAAGLAYGSWSAVLEYVLLLCCVSGAITTFVLTGSWDGYIQWGWEEGSGDSIAHYMVHNV